MAAASSVWYISHWELIFRLMMAALLGGLIGIEREWNNQAAGFRTHILVCLGSATIMLLSEYGFSQFVTEANVRIDPARLAAQVISGVGFLGAGAILRNGNVIKGLTTAASVWVVAAIGLSVGAGFFSLALFCTLLVLISLFLLHKWEKRMLRHRRTHEIEMKIADRPGSLGRIATHFGEQGVQIVNLKMLPDREAAGEDGSTPHMRVCFSLKIARQEDLLRAYENISALDIVVWMEASNFRIQKAAVRGKSA
ncbi:MgtC/SapB family protein [Paenibacillus cremeus]|uniref:MgtC/SapB family protein n=1 Tax=Paenibacillus cremeus TaxID=2163881 RepID=A0A559K4D5_9BACL|nr:MgtC/SapB family protein [Paenibacillus cremeus]TVY06991.1 MgtC/SapB family protein [Paenibacillus cremeus]